MSDNFLLCGVLKCPKMFELKFIHENKILVTRLTGHADFDKLFRILLSHFGELTSAEFSDIFTHGLIFSHFQTQNSA